MSEYVRVACPKCEAAVRVESDSVGEWVTCPKCDKDFVAEERRAPAKPTAKPARSRDDDEDDRPRKKSRRDDEDEADERPSRSKRPAYDSDDEEDEDDRPHKPRPGVCPGCGSRKSSRVTYTWWGGLIGPAIFGLVKCGKCRKQYMGSSGKPLGALQIIVYSLVVGAIGLVIGVTIALAAK